MDDIADRYRRLAASFADKVAAVPPERWSAPSPCEGWTARDLVRHVIEAHGLFLGLVGRELGEVPSVEDDPAGAFAAARARVQADLDDPERAGAEFEGFFGRSTFAHGVDRFLSTDLVLHGWDLARAAGLDETIDPDDVRRVFDLLRSFGDAARSPAAFGPEIEAPASADEQTRMLAFAGRRSF
jgi:uncharacterized protein (TIGR03086 family)